ncbi:hypothetical protein MITS9504_00594 [Synechococcus sp. MIT S9504]|nr:hypothetical protein MITS9504_00594 [Synechococcus sp. MIT S9504]
MPRRINPVQTGAARLRWRDLPNGVYWNLRANLQSLWLLKLQSPVRKTAQHIITWFDPNATQHRRRCLEPAHPERRNTKPTTEPDPATAIQLGGGLLGHAGSL